MYEQPDPSEREQELAHSDRQREEEAMRQAGHEDPELPADRPKDTADEPVHEA
jgi:hypothetical protein